MRIFVSVLAILFGGLHFIAGLTQFKSKGQDPAARSFAIVMACGGLSVVCAAIGHLVEEHILHTDALTAAMGCMLVCFAAYENGRRSGNLHLSHHIVRGAVAALLIAGFLIW